MEFEVRRFGSVCFSPYLSFLSVEGHSGEDDQVCQVKQEIHQE